MGFLILSFNKCSLVSLWEGGVGVGEHPKKTSGEANLQLPLALQRACKDTSRLSPPCHRKKARADATGVGKAMGTAVNNVSVRKHVCVPPTPLTVIIWGGERSSAHPGALAAVTLKMPVGQGCCLLEAQLGMKLQTHVGVHPPRLRES